MTVGALVGVYQFNTNDIGESQQPYKRKLCLMLLIGLTELIAKVWQA